VIVAGAAAGDSLLSASPPPVFWLHAVAARSTTPVAATVRIARENLFIEVPLLFCVVPMRSLSFFVVDCDVRTAMERMVRWDLVRWCG
jgi:hypothetical protein